MSDVSLKELFKKFPKPREDFKHNMWYDWLETQDWLRMFEAFVSGLNNIEIKIAEGDVPNIFVFQNKQLITKFWIYPDGTVRYRIFLPKTTKEKLLLKLDMISVAGLRTLRNDLEKEKNYEHRQYERAQDYSPEKTRAYYVKEILKKVLERLDSALKGDTPK